MKKLLLLPVLLLAACAPVAGSGGPFKAGDQFRIMGEVGSATTEEVVTVSRPGDRLRNGLWEYAATVRVADWARVRTTEDGRLFAAVTEVGGNVNLCITAPSGPGWSVSNGVLVRETSQGYERFLERLDGGASLRELSAGGGTCVVWRE